MSKQNVRKKNAQPRRRSGNPAKKIVQQLPAATFGDWVAAARIRTLPLAIAPVVIGTGAALLVTGRDKFHWVIALACLAVAVLLQIGVNYANDYSDGVRGTDDLRVGPARLVGSRNVNAKHVRNTAFVFFALAAIAGLAIVIRTQQWWMLVVGAVCIIAAWFYTGGKRPYGYNALGEVAVFIFFGLVATLGTTWVQAGSLPQEAWFGAIAAGFFACAVLITNNLRDIETDKLVGKRTLSVLIGRRASQILATLFLVLPFALSSFMAIFYSIAWLALLALLAAIPAILIIWTYRQPSELVIALALASVAALLYAGALFWAFWGAPLAVPTAPLP